MTAFDKNAITVLERRYLAKDENGALIETPEELLTRVARHIANADALFDANADVAATERSFFEMMAELSFMPNSPTLMNAGDL